MTRRNLAACLLFAASIPLGLIPESQSWAQATAGSPTQTDSEQSAARPESESEPLSVEEQIQQHLEDDQPAEAAKVLAAALESDPDNPQLRRSHRAISLGFLRARNYDQATNQLIQWFDFELPRTDSPRAANSLAGIIQQISVYGMRGEKADVVARAIDQAIARCRELESEHRIEIQSTLSRLVGLKASALSRDDVDAAKDLVAQELQKLKAINSSDDLTEGTLSAEISLLGLSARLFNNADSETRLESLFEQALKSFPESESLTVQFASHQYSTISSLAREKPDEASLRMKEAVARLTPYEEEFRGVQTILRNIKRLESTIEAGRKQQAMIGKPAPPLDIDGWANSKITSVDDLKGKVVLYDFWAIWCGPCIATFPHLREWREEFADQGFEVVGITRYYGYSWNEESETPTRSAKELSAEVEREAVEKFLQSKDMHHPTILTPKDSQMQIEYGVTGIPHAVLIDRNGIVRMIKIGSGQANADALYAKIKELVAN
ncbi:MAG: TlpA family protein disulfide reductase [Planctomycetales bacterium]|nr:TlpA family protein disulfide reductase [Planctomycetales bacterium]